MIERDTLKKLIAGAEKAAAAEQQATHKYQTLMKKADAQYALHQKEAGALTQLLELWYPD